MTAHFPTVHRMIVGDSAKVDWGRELEKNGRERADLCLVDGDHSEAACTADLEACDKVLRPGGFMVCHDYGGPSGNGVIPAVEKFRERHNYSVCLKFPTNPLAGSDPGIILQKREGSK